MPKLSDKVRSKMEKLLALTASSNEHEAAAASRQLHFLLARHNLSVVDINEDKLDIGKCDVEVEAAPWSRHIAKAIAGLYFCSMYYQQGRKSWKALFTINGSEVNRTFALALIKNTLKTLNTQAYRGARAERGFDDSSYITSFRNSASMRIISRCQELKAKAKEGTLQTEAGETLPSLVGVYERELSKIDDYYKLKGIKIETSNARSMQVTDGKGYEQGIEAANKIQLSRGIENKRKQKFLS